tara:strand:- start:19317 stop:19496 length:180 start_codon:yes stop_codon:yes gene_type:complete
MQDTLKILSNYPELGITSSVGSGIIHWLGVLNPILSFISLIIGISIGLMTIYTKIKGVK